MTFRDEDDDTSTGRMTQGGSTPRRGKSIWWVLIAFVLIAAVAIAIVSLPRKRAPAEENTTALPSQTSTAATSPSTMPSGATTPAPSNDSTVRQP